MDCFGLIPVTSTVFLPLCVKPSSLTQCLAETLNDNFSRIRGDFYARRQGD